MAIYYGVCDNFNGYRINIGRSMLSCGPRVLFFASGMSGEAVKYKAGIMPPAQFQDVLCADDFFARSASMNTRLNNNPLIIGCCTDATTASADTLLDTCIGGMSVSSETSLSVNGQGDPNALAGKRSEIGTVMVNAADLISGNVWGAEMVSGGGSAVWIQSGINFDLSLSSWNSGSINWTTFRGLGTQLTSGTGFFRADEYSYNVSLDTSNGMIEGQQTMEAYESHSTTTNCTPATVTSLLSGFATGLSSASFA